MLVLLTHCLVSWTQDQICQLQDKMVHPKEAIRIQHLPILALVMNVNSHLYHVYLETRSKLKKATLNKLDSIFNSIDSCIVSCAV